MPSERHVLFWLAAALAIAPLSTSSPARAGTAPAAARAPHDLSGAYHSESGTLLLMESGYEAVVSYSASFATSDGTAAHVCDCVTQFRRTSPTALTLTSSAGVEATLEQRGGDLSLTPGPTGWASCCGAGWSGDRFPGRTAEPPRACRLRQTAELLGPGDPDPRPTGVRAAKGAAVYVSVAGRASRPMGDYLVVRVPTEGHRAAIGLLPRDRVRCRADR
jgi:hypothetical protein